MPPEKIPGYFNVEEDYYEDMLKRKRREEGISREKKPEYEEKEAERVVIKKREAMPKLEQEKIKPLDFKVPEIIGGLFERTEFLKTRIAELEEGIKAREAVHKDIVEDIELDMSDKKDMANRVADINEKRNLMLDISVLRRERRLENLQFWRDTTELKHELRELLEKFETESKIVSIFEEMGKERMERMGANNHI